MGVVSSAERLRGQEVGSAIDCSAGRLAVGLMAFNEPDRILKTLSRLVQQTHKNLVIRVFDNSTDHRVRLATQELLRADERVSFHSNGRNLGAHANGVQAMEWARSQGEFFAIASDHDIVSENWAESLIRELRMHPEAVSAFALVKRIDEFNNIVKAPIPVSIIDDSPLTRARLVMQRGAGSGNMFYGIHRTAALRALRIHRTITPDLIFVAEVCFHGTIRRVDDAIYTRLDQAERMNAPSLISRQYDRLGLARAIVPYWVRNAALILRGGFPPRRTTAPTFALVLALQYLRRTFSSRTRLPRKRLRRVVKTMTRRLSHRARREHIRHGE